MKREIKEALAEWQRANRIVKHMIAAGGRGSSREQFFAAMSAVRTCETDLAA